MKWYDSLIKEIEDNGNNVFLYDLEGLLEDQKLNPAVINVLIDYVLRTNNNKFTKSYVETIAGHWKRSNVETAEEAMSIAEKEHKKNISSTKTKTKNKVIPSWFNERIESTTDEEDNDFKEFLEEFRK